VKESGLRIRGGKRVAARIAETDVHVVSVIDGRRNFEDVLLERLLR